MTGFNFFSHGSQDLYPKMLEEAKGLSSALASKATIISNCGANKSIPYFFVRRADGHLSEAPSRATSRNMSGDDSRECKRLLDGPG